MLRQFVPESATAIRCRGRTGHPAVVLGHEGSASRSHGPRSPGSSRDQPLLLVVIVSEEQS